MRECPVRGVDVVHERTQRLRRVAPAPGRRVELVPDLAGVDEPDQPDDARAAAAGGPLGVVEEGDDVGECAGEVGFV